ncbi:hypothetical protein [Cupriavidus basilensis]|uniref:hypothetical protein n=1 Tax=Cupriavidus basilensis TaxID=68895 RepID=UPI0023E75DB9|nr:hypothetical protein [Cupriavidus basilensis]MDF3885268.1 hypothetical protein [Cupriavidus basilensis]
MDELIFRKVKTAADIRNLPGWVGKVDPQQVKLKRVIWPYHLSHPMQCSLANCGTQHKDGVLIELEDGRISNIGHVCGADANKFGDDYLRARAAMSDDKVRAMILAALADRQTLTAIRSHAAAIENETYLWNRRVHQFATLFPSVCDELNRRRNTVGGLEVFEERERTEREITEAIEQGRARSRDEARYYRVHKGNIAGIEVMSIGSIRMDAVVRRADALCAVDPTGIKTSELNRLYTDLTSLPDEITRIASMISAGSRFFSRVNFELMGYFPLLRASRDRLLSLTVAELDKVKVSASEELGHKAAEWPNTRKLNKRQKAHYARAMKQASAVKK